VFLNRYVTATKHLVSNKVAASKGESPFRAVKGTFTAWDSVPVVNLRKIEGMA